MNIKEKYNEICTVLDDINASMNGQLIKIPQVYQAILKVEDSIFSIVTFTDSDYKPFIEEILLTTQIDIDDSWRLNGNKPRNNKKHFGNEIEDYDVSYHCESSKELIHALFKDAEFIEVMKEIGHHSFYVQEGQLFVHINPSHDITADFFKAKLALLQKTKQIIIKHL